MDAATSLFSYAPGKNTDTYTNRTGPGIRLTIAAPGALARLTFDGTAGQKLFVQVVAATLPTACGVLTLLDPAGKQLASGCILDGTGNIDAVELPATGRSPAEVDPRDDATGEVTLRLVTATDQQADLAPNGPEVIAAIGEAGAVARFSFAGTAGQKVFVDASSASLPNECGVLQLHGPDGRFLASGCLINGQGFIDRTVLASTGVHTIVVDPRDEATGQVRLRLIVATDQTGTAGQRIFVDVLGRGDRLQLRADGVVLPAGGQYLLAIDPADRGTGTATLRLRT